jgi:hypothetical protein
MIKDKKGFTKEILDILKKFNINCNDWHRIWITLDTEFNPEVDVKF